MDLDAASIPATATQAVAVAASAMVVHVRIRTIRRIYLTKVSPIFSGLRLNVFILCFLVMSIGSIVFLLFMVRVLLCRLEILERFDHFEKF